MKQTLNRGLTDREKRNLDILETIRKNNQISKTDISRQTGLNIVTVSNYVDNYIKEGLVIERGLDISTGGRRPTLVELNPNYGFVIGLDFGSWAMGETSIITVMIDFATRVMSKIKEKRTVEKIETTKPKFIELISKIIEQSQVPKDKIKGIGLALSGVIDKYAGTIRHPIVGGSGENYMSVKLLIEDKFGIPVFVENDHTVAVFGEKWTGLSLETEAENLLYICSDSGVGIMLGKEIYYGSSRSAGELNLNSPDPKATSDNCWENYSCPFRSQGLDLGLVSRAQRYFSEHKEVSSKILDLANGNLGSITFEIIIKASKEQDKIAMDLIVEAGERLGVKVAYLVNIFNPEVVILGRGIELAGSLLLDTVKKTVKRWAYEEVVKTVRIIPTKLGEDSVAIGAASIAMQRVFTQI